MINFSIMDAISCEVHMHVVLSLIFEEPKHYINLCTNNTVSEKVTDFSK